jgi:hypothetical protein
MRTLTRTSLKAVVFATAGTMAAGLFALQASAAGDLAFKRDDDAVDVIMTVDDDDYDDDTSAFENGTSRDGTGVSRSRRDATNSRLTGVSRDRDLSRRDLTRDFTFDGGDRTRDWSANRTNDRSRHDTRR